MGEKTVIVESIEFERLEKAIEALNTAKLVEEKIEYSLKEGFDPNKLLAQFMKAVEDIPFEKEKELPDIVVDLYNVVADGVKTVVAKVSECEMYSKGWDSKLKECKQCQKDYPDEHKKCKELTQPAQSADVPPEKKASPPEKVVKKDSDGGEKFEALKKKILGKDDSKLTFVIDKLLLKGGSVDKIFEEAAKEAKSRKLTTFTNSPSEILGLVKAREKSGWVFEKKESGHLQLVGYSK